MGGSIGIVEIEYESETYSVNITSSKCNMEKLMKAIFLQYNLNPGLLDQYCLGSYNEDPQTKQKSSIVYFGNEIELNQIGQQVRLKLLPCPLKRDAGYRK